MCSVVWFTYNRTKMDEISNQSYVVTSYLPILDSSTAVFAAADLNHNCREEEEEAGHGEAHAVHRLVAQDDITVHNVINARYTASTHAEPWYLANEKQQTNKRKSNNSLNIVDFFDRTIPT